MAPGRGFSLGAAVISSITSPAVCASLVGSHCWTGSFTTGQCCNEIFGPRGNPWCWDDDVHTFESCCGGRLYRASSCSDYITNFQFAALQYQGDSMEVCAQHMDADPARCNSPNTTRYSCPKCAEVSENLITYIRCVRQEQARPGVGGLGSGSRSAAARDSEAGDATGGGGSRVFVQGVHHPTLLRPRGHDAGFAFAAPAFDAYVGDQLIHEGHWMPQEAQLLLGLLNPGDVAVDAGANIGGFALPMSRRVGVEGQVHAFEPFRLLYQLLTANCAINGLQSCFTHHRGLGSKTASRLLRMPGLNAVGNPSKMFVADAVASEMHIHYDEHEETVEIIRLDDVPLPRLQLIKIDVESMELHVLQGAEQTLKRFRPVIYVEDSEAGDMLSMRMPTSVMKLLSEKHGYECINLPQSGLVTMTSLLCAPAERVAEVKQRVFLMTFNDMLP